MGRRGRACPLCTDLRAKADALLASGISYREAAESLGVSKWSVSRHARHTAQAADAPIAPGDELAASDQRLHVLTERCEASWLSCASNGDIRAGLDVLKTAVRLELENRARILAKQEAVTETATNAGPGVEHLDSIVRRYRAAQLELHTEALAGGEIDCPLCGTSTIKPSRIAERLRAYEEYNAGKATN